MLWTNHEFLPRSERGGWGFLDFCSMSDSIGGGGLVRWV